MVAPLPRGSEAVNDQILNNIKELQANLARQMQGMGMDPYRNRFAQGVMNRANEAQLLSNLMDVGSGGVQDFARQWLQARLGPASGGAGSYNGQDLSRGGIANFMRGAMQNNDPNSALYQALNSGDWDADSQMLAAVQGMMNQGRSPLMQQAAQRTLDRWLMQARGWTQDNPTYSGSPLDLFQGRTPAPTPGIGQGQGAPGSLLPGAGGGQPAYAGGTPGWIGPGGGQSAAGGDQTMWAGGTPNFNEATGQYGSPTGAGGGRPSTFPNPTAYSQSAAGPQGSLTPPVNAGGPVSYANANDLLNQYRYDQRNWGTRMYGTPGQAFSIGGVTYNPGLEAGQGAQRYRNMSGQGRETARGSNFGVFLYRLQSLVNQRNAGGNAALGITPQTTDAELARMAAQFVTQNYVGQSAFQVA